MENKNFAHMEPSKEIIGLSMMERVHLASLSGLPSGDLTKIKPAISLSGQLLPSEKESLENYGKFSDAMDIKYYQSVQEAINEKTYKVATGRKAGREKKSALESLKVHHHKIQLAAKRDEVNFVEDILDKTRERTIPIKWNAAIMNLNPLGGHFIEEGILQENLRKIQGLK